MGLEEEKYEEVGGRGHTGSEKKRLEGIAEDTSEDEEMAPPPIPVPREALGFNLPASLALAHPNYSHSPHKTRHPLAHISSHFTHRTHSFVNHILFKDRAKQSLRTRTSFRTLQANLFKFNCIVANANAKIMYRKNMQASQTDLQFCSKVVSAQYLFGQSAAAKVDTVQQGGEPSIRLRRWRFEQKQLVSLAHADFAASNFLHRSL